MLISTGPFSHFFWKVYTGPSASPLEEGWYGAVLMCLMTFLFVKNLKSLLVKHGPLFVTNINILNRGMS